MGPENEEDRILGVTDNIAKDLRSCHVSEKDTPNLAKWKEYTSKVDSPSDGNDDTEEKGKQIFERN